MYFFLYVNYTVKKLLEIFENCLKKVSVVFPEIPEFFFFHCVGTRKSTKNKHVPPALAYEPRF